MEAIYDGRDPLTGEHLESQDSLIDSNIFHDAVNDPDMEGKKHSCSEIMKDNVTPKAS